MGPMRTPTCSGVLYVMVIVDDLSRYTCVYFLTSKSETVSKFIAFQTLVEKQFGMRKGACGLTTMANTCQMSFFSIAVTKAFKAR